MAISMWPLRRAQDSGAMIDSTAHNRMSNSITISTRHGEEQESNSDNMLGFSHSKKFTHCHRKAPRTNCEPVKYSREISTIGCWRNVIRMPQLRGTYGTFGGNLLPKITSITVLGRSGALTSTSSESSDGGIGGGQ